MRGNAPRTTGSFPDTYSAVETERLFSVYEAAPDRVARSVEGLDRSALGARVIPSKWTIQEIVCHVADSETVGAIRIRLALAEPGAAFPGYDQGRFAEGLGYASFDAPLVRDTLDLFSRLRSISARLLRRATPEAWKRAGVHPEWGPVTLRQLLELYADHGERHLEQILERRRRLGLPLAMDRLLPERLY